MMLLGQSELAALDLFGGSGSTLIACEQTGRRCFMMEINALLLRRHHLQVGAVHTAEARADGGSMKTGEKLFRFLASLILREFYGTVIIRFEGGKVTHVETQTRRMWQYKDLPEEMSGAFRSGS